MSQYPFDRILSKESDVLDYFINAIQYRNMHKDRSADIAMHVFDMTHPKLRLTFPIDSKTNQLRDEFGALEAPGWSEDETKSRKESEDEAWNLVLDLVRNAKKDRAV